MTPLLEEPPASLSQCFCLICQEAEGGKEVQEAEGQVSATCCHRSGLLEDAVNAIREA